MIVIRYIFIILTGAGRGMFDGGRTILVRGRGIIISWIIIGVEFGDAFLDISEGFHRRDRFFHHLRYERKR